MFNILSVLPFAVFLVWLGLLIYMLLLAIRLVNAVEQIARSIAYRPPDAAGR